MLKKITGMLACTILSMATYANETDATPTCEFAGGDDIGVCFRNETGQDLNSQISMRVLAGQYSHETQFNVFPPEWYPDSFASLDQIKKLQIPSISYVLTTNQKPIAGCSYTIDISQATKMSAPKILKIQKSEQLFCTE